MQRLIGQRDLSVGEEDAKMVTNGEQGCQMQTCIVSFSYIDALLFKYVMPFHECKRLEIKELHKTLKAYLATWEPTNSRGRPQDPKKLFSWSDYKTSK
jgi:hypothetical protein